MRSVWKKGKINLKNKKVKQKKKKELKKEIFLMKEYERPLLFLIETSEEDVLSVSTQDSTDYDLGWIPNEGGN